MGNYIKFKAEATTRLHLSKDKRYIICETFIVDKRPVAYYRKHFKMLFK